MEWVELEFERILPGLERVGIGVERFLPRLERFTAFSSAFGLDWSELSCFRAFIAWIGAGYHFFERFLLRLERKS